MTWTADRFEEDVGLSPQLTPTGDFGTDYDNEQKAKEAVQDFIERQNLYPTGEDLRQNCIWARMKGGRKNLVFVIRPTAK